MIDRITLKTIHLSKAIFRQSCLNQKLIINIGLHQKIDKVNGSLDER